MFTNISWADYLVIIAILLFFYYSYIGIRYFSFSLKKILLVIQKLRFNSAFQDFTKQNEITTPSYDVRKQPEYRFSEKENLQTKLQEIIADASRRKMVIEELKEYLHFVLKEYSSLSSTPYKLSVNDFIISECSRYGIFLGDSEVNNLWK